MSAFSRILQRMQKLYQIEEYEFSPLVWSTSKFSSQNICQLEIIVWAIKFDVQAITARLYEFMFHVQVFLSPFVFRSLSMEGLSPVFFFFFFCNSLVWLAINCNNDIGGCPPARDYLRRLNANETGERLARATVRRKCLSLRRIDVINAAAIPKYLQFYFIKENLIHFKFQKILFTFQWGMISSVY